MNELGAGGMGVVYLAEHSLLGRRAAIKVLKPELSRQEGVVQRFFNEARATSHIQHPSIVSCLDFGYDADGCAYIVMEYLEGETLGARLERLGRLPVDRIVALMRQVASALDAAHAKGVVHRDLKPDNIFLVADGEAPGGERAKVLDFGIAKLAGDVGIQNVYKTRTGSIIGTPVYMSPEQCRGTGRMDERTDIYSLGCVMYQMLCGRPPFVAEGYGDLIAMHITAQPTAPRQIEPSAPIWIEDLILRMLAKSADERPISMAAVVAALEAKAGEQAPAPTPAGPPAITAPGGVVTSLAMMPTTLGLSAAEHGGSRRRHSRWLAPLAALAVIVVGIVVFASFERGQGDDPAPPAAASQPSGAAPVAAAADAAPVAPSAAAVVPAPAASPDAGPATSAPPRTARKPKALAPAGTATAPSATPDAERAARKKRVKGSVAEPDFGP